jgi:hypothetical protein
MAELTVVLFKMPESNGKTNWQAYFRRKGDTDFEGLVGSMGGICINWGECWNRVAYEAERARFLLGERNAEPSLMGYGKDVSKPEDWEGVDPEAADWNL